MSDRSSVEITLYGVAGHEEELADIFSDWQPNWGEAWPPGGPSAEHFVDGITIVDDERPLGTLSEVGPALEELGVSYYGEQAAKYEYAAEVRMFTPELGVFCSDSNGEGAVLVAGTIIDNVIRDHAWVGGSSVVKALNMVTGKAHRDAFDALQKGLDKAE